MATRRALIQNSLCLRDDQKFAAIDPKLLSLHPPPTKCAPSLLQQQQQDVLKAGVTTTEMKVTPQQKSKGRRKPQGSALNAPPKLLCQEDSSKIDLELGVNVKTSPQNERKSKRKSIAKSNNFESLKPVKSPAKPAELEPKSVNPEEEVASERPKRNARHPDKPQAVAPKSEESLKTVSPERSKRKSLSRKEVANILQDPSPVKPCSEPVFQSPKLLLRPSVLGDFGSSGQSIKEGSFSAGASSLIVSGKRQWKPSLKMQQKQEEQQNSTTLFGKSELELPSPLIKQSITQYADAVTHSKKTDKVQGIIH